MTDTPLEVDHINLMAEWRNPDFSGRPLGHSFGPRLQLDISSCTPHLSLHPIRNNYRVTTLHHTFRQSIYQPCPAPSKPPPSPSSSSPSVTRYDLPPPPPPVIMHSWAVENGRPRRVSRISRARSLGLVGLSGGIRYETFYCVFLRSCCCGCLCTLRVFQCCNMLCACRAITIRSTVPTCSPIITCREVHSSS